MKGLVVTYLLAYGGAAVALFNPFVGVCIYWLFDIVRPQYMFAWAGTEGSFSEIIAIATVVGWAIRGGGSWRFGRGSVVVGLVAVFTVWALLSAALAPNGDVALAFVRELTKRALMFLLAVTLADSVARVKALAWVLVGSAAYVCLEMNLRYLAGVNEVQMYGYGGMDNNSLAISFVTCFGPALFLGLHAQRLWQKALALSAAALIGHTVLLTFSRGGILGLVVSGVAAMVVVPKRPRYLVVAALALAVGLRLAGPELRERFGTSFSEEQERDESAQGRVELWADCLQVIARYPFFGVGPDHFGLIAEEFGWPKGKEAHSLWLQVAAEVGAPGAIALALVYLVAAGKLWRFARGRPTTELASWGQSAACMVVTALTGFVVSAQFVTIEGLETPLYVVAIAVGTLRLLSVPVVATTPMVAGPAASARPPGFPGVPTVGAGLARSTAIGRRPGA